METAGSIQIGKEKPLRITPISCSPCSSECPLGTNVKAYVSLIAAGKFSEALEVVRRTNPFPGICGRVCPRPCEEECLRNEIDEPLSIAALKRFLADYELHLGILPGFEKLGGDKSGRNKTRVAVIGAGPAGLTCASDLAGIGYAITVFESLPVPGGMLAVGIPAYRLPRDILRVEIEAIEALGVDIVLNTRIGDKIKLDDLVKEYEAVFIATGAQTPSRLGIIGERDVRQGIINWVSLLKEAGLGRGQNPGENIVVVGGGNTAVDSARVALRLGAGKVNILYRRSREQMPAFQDEVIDAEEEGIEIKFLCSPVRLIEKKGRLIGVECIRMQPGKADESGRPVPLPVENSEFVIPCNAIIPAIGQELDTTLLAGKNNIRLSERNLIQADPLTMATTQAGVFAGGDAVAGPAGVLEAIASGHCAAGSVHRFINEVPPEEPRVEELSKEMTIDLPILSKKPRIQYSRASASERRSSFNEINQAFTQAQAVTEAERCLRCGPCLECTTCLGVCENKQVIIEPENLTEEQKLKTELRLIRVSPEIHRVLAVKERASALYKEEEYQASVFTVKIDERLCRGCGLCEEICEYRAVRVTYRGNGVFSAGVDEDMCKGCGTCVSVCPTGAIDQNFFTSERMAGQITACLREPGVLIFSCHWNPAMKSLPESLPREIIRVMCTGRIRSGDILKAFENGAKGVLILGCSDEDCHYGFGSKAVEANLERLSDILELLGLEKERLGVIRIDREQELLIGEFLNSIKRRCFY